MAAPDACNQSEPGEQKGGIVTFRKRRRSWVSLAAVAVLVITALVGGVASAATTTISFPDFSDVSPLTLNGRAATVGNPVSAFGRDVLRLTDGLSQGGSAFLTDAIPLEDAGGFKASFSTAFQFQITDPVGCVDTDGVRGADGIVFVVQTVANNVGGIGGGIGYLGIGNSVGVEFDTWNNGGGDGFNGNHVGIDLNGSVSSVARAPYGPTMNNGSVYSAWVDYDGDAQLLEVRINTTDDRPLLPILSYNVDLPAVLGQPEAFVGFTSGTGCAGGDHDIVSWTFTNEFDPIGDEELCNGVPATIEGTDGDDELHGTDGPDVIVGLGGNDSIFGFGGNDLICGGPGDDRIYGDDGNDDSEGNDIIFGDDGNDTLKGGPGNDIIDGGADRDNITGGLGNDLIFGGDGDDNLYGQEGADEVWGGPGYDRIYGGTEDDVLHGEDGNDAIKGEDGNDLLTGGEGDDTLDGRAGDDMLLGQDGNDRLYGGDGNDAMDGGDGNDTFYAGEGDDSLQGGTGADRLRGEGGTDTCDGGVDADTDVPSDCEVEANIP